MSGKLALSDLDIGVLDHSLVLIKDDLHCDGHFVVLASVRQALGDGRQVLLAHLRWPQSHYLTSLRRVGCSADSLRQLVTFIDLHTAFRADLQAPEGSLRTLYMRLASHLADQTGPFSNAVTLVVDALTSLQDLRPAACSDMDWLQFLAQLRGIPSLFKALGAVLLVHGDIQADDLWVKQLQHSAQVTWEVESMPYAHAASFNGQLTGIWRGGRPLSMGNARGQQQDLRPLMLRDIRKQYTFRLRDGAVELSEPGSAGMSSLVL